LRPNLIHAHGTEGAHVVAARRSGLPHVVTVQGLYSHLNPILKTPWYGRQAFIAWLENYTLRRTRFAIAKSGFVMDLLRQRFPRLQLFQIPNTYDPACLALPPVAKEPFSLVYVGTMNPWKGVHLLAQAVAQLAARFPQLSLRLIGGGREDAAYWRPQEDLLRKALGSRLKIMYQLPRPQVLEFVARSAVLVAPSLWEMFGNQIIEALLVRTPCVVSSGTALAESIERFGNGSVFRNGDVADLAAQIEQALRRPAGVEVEEARARIIAYMQPARVAQATLQVYRQVLCEAGVPAGTVVVP
jgi:glycosyltransferase involved in cell wall biosynthesis